MAVEKLLASWSAEANADLSAKQYFLVKYSSGKLVLATAGSNAFALQNKPTSGQQGEIALVGVTKVILGGTASAGDYVSSDGNGKAVVATNTVASGTAANGTHIVGQLLADGVSGDIVPMLVNQGLS